MSDKGRRQESKEPAEFGSGESTGQVFSFYMDQVAVLQGLYESPEVNSAPDRIASLYPLLFSIHSTGLSISILARHGRLNECFMLARAFLERLINFIYLLFCEEDEYLRYLAHTKQKGFRILNRSIKAGDLRAELKWSGSIDLSNEPKFKEAIDLFTSEKGREITRWTSVTLPDRLALIADKGGLKIGPLMLALLGIYQDASEALHGTLYGSIFHIGVFTKKLPSRKSELYKTYNEQFSMLFFMLGVCVDSLVRAIHKVLPINELQKRSKENIHTVSSGKWLPKTD